VGRQDLQRWTVRLLGEYSTAYASNQFRAVRRFLRWLAAEQDRPDPTSGLRAPTAKPRLVRVFTSEGLSVLRRACPGPDGIYQIVANVGEKAGVVVYPHRFWYHFSHTWLDRGGAGGDLMELNGWTSPQMLQWYGGSARGARARRNYDRIMSG
jgi:hypothetical protein